MNDELEVLSTCRFVISRAEDVFINEAAVSDVASEFVKNKITPPPWNREFHFYDGTEKTLNYIIVLDALNFSFFSHPGKPRWTINYNGKKYNGYWALALALKKAFFVGEFPLWDAEFLSDIKRDVLRKVLAGEEEIPMFEERLANLQEIGQVLLTDYNGKFSTMVEESEGDAVKLVSSVVRKFSSFRDEADYCGEKIYFYKRAQILVSDLAGVFFNEGWGRFRNKDKLTAFADYKIPQVLRAKGILKYSEELSEIVDNRRFIDAGSNYEIEIRASTIWGVELIKTEMKCLGKSFTSAEIDWMLWQMGQGDIENMKPYHLTRTIYY